MTSEHQQRGRAAATGPRTPQDSAAADPARSTGPREPADARRRADDGQEPASRSRTGRRPTADAGAAVAGLTDDLQRLQAEYVNYKRRVDRDRELVKQNATFSVLSALLPVLDDLDRAREHGELEGGFKAVADSLERIVAAHGLVKFGSQGDAFDPRFHEALMHAHSPGRHHHDLPDDRHGRLPDRRPRRTPGPGHRGRPRAGATGRTATEPARRRAADGAASRSRARATGRPDEQDPTRRHDGRGRGCTHDQR